MGTSVRLGNGWVGVDDACGGIRSLQACVMIGLFFGEWMEGQKQKILRGLDRLEVAVTKGVLPDPGQGPASADEVAVAVATAMTSQMGYLGINWDEGRPHLASWMNNWEKRKSLVNTPPLKDWVVDADTKASSKI